MEKIWMKRSLRGLEANDDDAADLLRKVKPGEVVRAEISRPRNVAFHRKFFAMLNLVWESAGDWESKEALLDDLKYRLGYVERHKIIDRRTGEIFEYVKLKSISFVSMDDLAFEEFYNRAMQELCTMAGGIEIEALRNEIVETLATA